MRNFGKYIVLRGVHLEDNNIRYQLIPQMKEYDDFGSKTRWRPFLMFGHVNNFASSVVNTDDNGLRLNAQISSDSISVAEFIKKKEKPNIVLGGSTAFGIGATSDANTLSSLLTKSSNSQWLNFGGRAYTGVQEWLQFQFYGTQIEAIDNFVHFSGLNDLFCAYWTNEIDEDFGPFFFAKSYKEIMERAYSEMSFVQLVELFKKKVKRRLGLEKDESLTYEELLTSYQQKNDNIFVALKMIEKNLYQTQKLMKGWASQQIFVLQPIAQWINKKHTKDEQALFDFTASLSPQTKACMEVCLSKQNYDVYSRKISEICEKLDIKFIDMNVLFSENCSDEDWLFVDHVHLTDKGYKLASSLLFQELYNG